LNATDAVSYIISNGVGCLGIFVLPFSIPFSHFIVSFLEALPNSVMASEILQAFEAF